MNGIPINTIPYLLAGLATLVVGIRSTQNYRKLQLPLSRHFAISGYLASLGLFLYSIPFIFTNDQQVLKVSLVIGRAALDAVAYLQFYLIWYLTSLKQYSLRWFIFPMAIVGIGGYLLQLQSILFTATVIQDGIVVYSYSSIYRFVHLFSLLIVFAAGVILARSAFLQTKTRAKVRLFSIALLYMGASAGDMYSMLFLQGLNNSPVVLMGYLLAAGVFLTTTLIFAKQSN